jgi:hypothetical protein
MLAATDQLERISDNLLRKAGIMTWLESPKWLESALKELCCLARPGKGSAVA